MKATHAPGLSDLIGPDREPGSYEFANGMLWFMCPGPCKGLSAIHVDGKGEAQRNWTWDGNVEAPTLVPSINHQNCWHGWLRAGEFIEA